MRADLSGPGAILGLAPFTPTGLAFGGEGSAAWAGWADGTDGCCFKADFNTGALSAALVVVRALAAGALVGLVLLLAAGLGGTGGATFVAVVAGAAAGAGLATGAVLEATTTFLAGAGVGAAVPADEGVGLRADLGAGAALEAGALADFRFLLAGVLGLCFSAAGLTPALAVAAVADFGALADDLVLSATEATEDLAEAGAGEAAGAADGAAAVFPAAGLADLTAGLELPLVAPGPVLATR